MWSTWQRRRPPQQQQRAPAVRLQQQLVGQWMRRWQPPSWIRWAACTSGLWGEYTHYVPCPAFKGEGWHKPSMVVTLRTPLQQVSSFSALLFTRACAQAGISQAPTRLHVCSCVSCCSHVSLMYRELLKAMKAELSLQAAAQQQATAQLLAQALEAQKQQVRQDCEVEVWELF